MGELLKLMNIRDFINKNRLEQLNKTSSIQKDIKNEKNNQTEALNIDKKKLKKAKIIKELKEIESQSVSLDIDTNIVKISIRDAIRRFELNRNNNQRKKDEELIDELLN